MSDETKEFLKTPRGKAIIKLGLYVIFFIIVAILFRSGNDIKPNSNNETVVKNPLEKYSEMTNYEYSYLFNDILIEGRVYHDIMNFTLNEEEYYIDSNSYKVNENILEPIELDKLYYLNNHDVSNYLKYGNVVSKNEDYENSVIATTYNINLNELDLNYSRLDITVYEKNNLIFKVLVKIGTFSELSPKSDLSDYIINTIEIDYANIGKVSNFTVNYVKE